MSIFALALILSAAAIIHATWNLINKQASGHATFTWLVAVLSALFYAPATIAIIEIFEIEISFVAIGMMAGSAALHRATSSAPSGVPSGRPIARVPAGPQHRAAALLQRRRLYFSASGRR